MFVELNAYAQWSFWYNDLVHVTLNHTRTVHAPLTLCPPRCVYRPPYAVTSYSRVWRGFGFVLIEKSRRIYERIVSDLQELSPNMRSRFESHLQSGR